MTWIKPVTVEKKTFIQSLLLESHEWSLIIFDDGLRENETRIIPLPVLYVKKKNDESLCVIVIHTNISSL